MNKKLAETFYKTAELLEIKGTAFKPTAYRKAAKALESLQQDVAEIYQKEGLRGLDKIPGIGKSIAQKIEEYIKKGKIKYCQELEKETAIRQIVTYYFESKGLSLAELKQSAKKRKIVYSRYTKPAKQLLDLAGSLEKAKEAINKVSGWARSRELDYTIETVFKKWLELDKLKPKEVVKKPYYQGNLMVWSQTRKKWYVIDPDGSWLEFAGKEQEVEWKIV